MHQIDSIAEDRLEGAEGIADFLGVTLRRARYLIETNRIPYGREGRVIVGSKSALREHWRQCTSGTPQAA